MIETRQAVGDKRNANYALHGMGTVRSERVEHVAATRPRDLAAAAAAIVHGATLWTLNRQNT